MAMDFEGEVATQARRLAGQPLGEIARGSAMIEVIPGVLAEECLTLYR